MQQRLLRQGPTLVHQVQQRLVAGLHAIKIAAAHDFLNGIEITPFQIVAASIGVDQDFEVGGPAAIEGLEQTLGDHRQQGFGQGAAYQVFFLGGVHAQHPLHGAHGRVGVQGAQHQVARLGGLKGRCQSGLVTDFADQNHIGVLA